MSWGESQSSFCSHWHFVGLVSILLLWPFAVRLLRWCFDYGFSSRLQCSARLCPGSAQIHLLYTLKTSAMCFAVMESNSICSPTTSKCTSAVISATSMPSGNSCLTALLTLQHGVHPDGSSWMPVRQNWYGSGRVQTCSSYQTTIWP